MRKELRDQLRRNKNRDRGPGFGFWTGRRIVVPLTVGQRRARDAKVPGLIRSLMMMPKSQPDMLLVSATVHDAWLSASKA
jgi:hypothetical protein